jgi:hypothetical protein
MGEKYGQYNSFQGVFCTMELIIIDKMLKDSFQGRLCTTELIIAVKLFRRIRFRENHPIHNREARVKTYQIAAIPWIQLLVVEIWGTVNLIPTMTLLPVSGVHFQEHVRI